VAIGVGARPEQGWDEEEWEGDAGEEEGAGYEEE
jgi:hypothetical protein